MEEQEIYRASIGRHPGSNVVYSSQGFQTFGAAITQSPTGTYPTSIVSPIPHTFPSQNFYEPIVNPLLTAVGDQFDGRANTSIASLPSQQYISDIPASKDSSGSSRTQIQFPYPRNEANWSSGRPNFSYRPHGSDAQSPGYPVIPFEHTSQTVQERSTNSSSYGRPPTESAYGSTVDAHRFSGDADRSVPMLYHQRSQQPHPSQSFPTINSDRESRSIANQMHQTLAPQTSIVRSQRPLNGFSPSGRRTSALRFVEANEYAYVPSHGLPIFPVLSPEGDPQFQTRSPRASSNPRRPLVKATPPSSMSVATPPLSSHQSHLSPNSINEDDAAICSICGKVASRAKKPGDRKSNLQRHKREKHTVGQPKHACDKCGNTFERSENLRRHQKNCHRR